MDETTFRLASIRSGDEITYHHDAGLETGIVAGWLDRQLGEQWVKCVTLQASKLWVPVNQVVSRTRREGCGAGTIAFESMS